MLILKRFLKAEYSLPIIFLIPLFLYFPVIWGMSFLLDAMNLHKLTFFTFLIGIMVIYVVWWIWAISHSGLLHHTKLVSIV
ncbi:MAG TPA: hypothetical protein VGF14_07040, partial [Alphaproteobacteria bacterium]